MKKSFILLLTIISLNLSAQFVGGSYLIDRDTKIFDNKGIMIGFENLHINLTYHYVEYEVNNALTHEHLTQLQYGFNFMQSVSDHGSIMAGFQYNEIKGDYGIILNQERFKPICFNTGILVQFDQLGFFTLINLTQNMSAKLGIIFNIN